MPYKSGFLEQCVEQLLKTALLFSTQVNIARKILICQSGLFHCPPPAPVSEFIKKYGTFDQVLGDSASPNVKNSIFTYLVLPRNR